MEAKLAVVLEEAGSHLLAGLGPDRSETECEHEFSAASREIDLSGAGDVAILRALVFPLHLEVCRKILPSIGATHESDGHLLPRCGRGQCQRRTIALGEKCGQALVVAHP